MPPKTKPAPRRPKAEAAHDLLFPEEVAAALRIAKRTVYDLCKRGDIAALKVASEWRIPRTALADYLARAAKG